MMFTGKCHNTAAQKASGASAASGNASQPLCKHAAALRCAVAAASGTLLPLALLVLDRPANPLLALSALPSLAERSASSSGGSSLAQPRKSRSQPLPTPMADGSKPAPKALVLVGG